MELTTYITFNGEASEAIEYYKKAFGAKIINIMHYGDMPKINNVPNMPDDQRNMVLQALLEFGESKIRISDSVMENIDRGNMISLAANFKTADEVKKVWNNLKDGADIQMPLEETFFSPCYGEIIDKYGIWWRLIADK